MKIISNVHWTIFVVGKAQSNSTNGLKVFRVLLNIVCSVYVTNSLLYKVNNTT